MVACVIRIQDENVSLYRQVGICWSLSSDLSIQSLSKS